MRVLPALFLAAGVVASMLVVPQRGYCADGVMTGEFIVEPATLHCLGFEWTIQGDDNHNAQVSVRYRPAGQQQWQEGLPMLRIGDEKVWRSREHLEHWTPRMFAGSILNLEKDTDR